MFELVYSLWRDTVFSYDDAYFSKYDSLIDSIVIILTLMSLGLIALSVFSLILWSMRTISGRFWA